MIGISVNFRPVESWIDALLEQNERFPSQTLQWFQRDTELGFRLHLKAAVRWLQAGVPSRALELLMPLTKIMSREPALHLMIAIMWKQLGNTTLFKESALKAFEIDPTLAATQEIIRASFPAREARVLLRDDSHTRPGRINAPRALSSQEQAVTRATIRRATSQLGEAAVQIIIPTFGQTAACERLLGSLAASLRSNKTRLAVLVIDDAFPGRAHTARLRSLCKQYQFGFVRSPSRGGFIGAANLGLGAALASGFTSDVLLLNSDCVVPTSDWLDRLAAHFGRDPDLGTVMPFSNNAEFGSFPKPLFNNPLPQREALLGLDRSAAMVNRHTLVQAPGGIGFCWLIRRACLQAVGLFDDARLQSGYGEDMDFSAKATQAGYSHGIATDVYVGHEGSLSYGAAKSQLVRSNGKVLRQRYPGLKERYEAWCRIDPLKLYRDRISAKWPLSRLHQVRVVA